MKNVKRTLSLLLVSVMCFGLFAGCGGGKTDPTPTPDANASAPVESASWDGKNLSLCIASQPQTIDPALNSSVDGSIMTQHMFEGLLKWAPTESVTSGSDGTCNDAELVPGQAESWKKVLNADGTATYTFKLRDGIKWSDGKDVTAEDFVYSWQRLANPLTVADYTYMIDMVKGYDECQIGTPTGEVKTVTDEETGEEKEVEVMSYDTSKLAVKAVDAKTFEVTLKSDTPYFLEICAFPATLPVRSDMIEAHGDAWTFSTESYIGNGAYKLTQWEDNAKIVMEKNAEYYDYANLGPETITFMLMDNDNAMLSAYNANDLQFIQDMPVDEIPGLLASGEMKIVDYIGTYYVCYQTQKAPFDDPRVRKAFTLAIDAQYIVDNITQTGEIPASGFVPGGVYDAEGAGSDFRTVGGDYWTPATAEDQYAANLEEANKLLDDAGYADRSTFPTATYLYNTNDRHKAIGEALQNMWSEGLGVTVKLENQDWAVFLETRKQGDYEIARNGWIADYNDPCSFLDMWYTGGGNNDAQYSNADYDAAIDAAKATDDPAERMAAFHTAEDLIIGQDWALGPIYFYTQKYMIKSDVKDMFYTPLGYFFFQYATQG